MFGVAGNGQFISEVLCNGNETHPLQCTTRTGDEVCDSYAGVICRSKYPTYLKLSGFSGSLYYFRELCFGNSL